MIDLVLSQTCDTHRRYVKLWSEAKSQETGPDNNTDNNTAAATNNEEPMDNGIIYNTYIILLLPFWKTKGSPLNLKFDLHTCI